MDSISNNFSMREYLAGIKKQALGDPDSKRDLKMYTDILKLDPNEAERRVVRQYADQNNILFPTSDIPLPENSFTVGKPEEIQFEPVDYCLGVVLSNGRKAVGAHIVADDENPDEKSSQIIDQIASLSPEDVTEITFLSSHLGETQQHKSIVSEVEKRFPNLKINKIKRSTI